MRERGAQYCDGHRAKIDAIESERCQDFLG